MENGLCIGCGLCRAVAEPGAIEMVMTPEGRERPIAVSTRQGDLDPHQRRLPGDAHRWSRPGASERLGDERPAWGSLERLSIGHASDPEVRFRGSSGGVLTALGQFLLDSGRVKFVLHVGASRSLPMRTDRRLSFDAVSVLENAGSRYGPVAPLADFREILDRGEPFALIAKPCDVTAVRNLAKLDPRVGELMRYALAFVCGGASDLSKSEQALQRFGLREDELALFRYRGHGNPGMNRIETTDGRAFELTYRQMWEDEIDG